MADGRPQAPWVWAAVLSLAACCVLAALRPLRDPDLPWHLAVGRAILGGRSIASDYFSYTMSGRPVPYEAVSDVLLYGAYRAWPPIGLHLLSAFVLAVLAFLLTARLGRGTRTGALLTAPLALAALGILLGTAAILALNLRRHVLRVRLDELAIREREVARKNEELRKEIEERKAAQEASARLGMAVEQVGETIVITDTEGVIQYVYDKYGEEHAAVGSNVVTFRARSAVRDVGKALGFPLPLLDQVAKALDTTPRA